MKIITQQCSAVLIFTATYLVPQIAYSASVFDLTYSYKTKFTNQSLAKLNSTCVLKHQIIIKKKHILEKVVSVSCKTRGKPSSSTPQPKNSGNLYKINNSYSENIICTWKAGSTIYKCSNGSKTIFGKNPGSTEKYTSKQTFKSQVKGTKILLDHSVISDLSTSRTIISFDTKNCSQYRYSIKSNAKGVRYSGKPIKCKIVR